MGIVKPFKDNTGVLTEISSINGDILTTGIVPDFSVKGTTQSITAATQAITVTDGAVVTNITSDAAYTLTSAPTIASGRDGQYIILFNSGSNNIILRDQGTLTSSNLRLAATSRTLLPNNPSDPTILALLYSTTANAWVEQYFGTYLRFAGSISTFNKDGITSETQEIGGASIEFSATPPVFNATFVGLPSSVTINIGGTASSEEVGSDYPITNTTFLGTPPAYIVGSTSTTVPSKKYYRGTVVNQTTTFQITAATVSGTSGLTSGIVTTTWNNRRYAGPKSGTTITTAQILALDNTANGTSDLTNSSTTALAGNITTGVGESIWYAHRSALSTITYIGITTNTSGNYTGGVERIGFSGGGGTGAPALLGVVSHTNDFGAVENFQPYYSISTNLGSKTVTPSTTALGNRRYAGPLSTNGALTSANILSLDDNTATGASSLSTTDGYGNFTVNITGTNYLRFAHPASQTTITFMSFAGQIMGFTATANTSPHTNDFGYAEDYKTYTSISQGSALGSNTLITSSSRPLNRIYIGPSTNGTATITTAQILSLDDTADGTSRLSSIQAFNYTPIIISGSNYLWFCHPSAISDLITIKDNSTGFAIGGAYQNNITHTNEYGFSETYRCWRSTNPGIFPTTSQVNIT